MEKIAKFNVGDMVKHKRQNYRAIVVDIDPIFQASGRYNPQACKRDFSQRNPWYRLLIDNSTQSTYVEECLLEADSNQSEINNPAVSQYLVYQQGQYHKTQIYH